MIWICWILAIGFLAVATELAVYLGKINENVEELERTLFRTNKALDNITTELHNIGNKMAKEK